MTVSAVNSESVDYQEMKLNWQLPETLWKGQAAIKAGRELFLPREAGETLANYSNKLERAVLYNKYQWAIKSATGRIFSKPIIMKEDTPEQIINMEKNYNMLGDNMDTFWKMVIEDTYIYGISYVMPEFPVISTGASLDDIQDRRPYAVHVRAAQVIQTVPEIDLSTGKVSLKRAHIREYYPVYNEWDYTLEEQIRVLYPGGWELYRIDQDDNWIIVSSGETGLNYIPLIPIYGKKLGFFKGISPFHTLADLNLRHWQSLADQITLLHYARVPILLRRGMTAEEQNTDVEIGSGKIYDIFDAEGDMKYVEHTGKALGSGEEDIINLESRMDVEAYEVMKGSSPVGSKAIDTSQANSSLKDIAKRLEDSIEETHKIMAEYLGMDDGGRIEVNRDFGLLTREGSEPNLLMKLYQAGVITRETCLQGLQDRGVLRDDLDIEAEAQAAEEERESRSPDIEGKEEEEEGEYLNADGKPVVGEKEKEGDMGIGNKKRIE